MPAYLHVPPYLNPHQDLIYLGSFILKLRYERRPFVPRVRCLFINVITGEVKPINAYFAREIEQYYGARGIPHSLHTITAARIVLIWSASFLSNNYGHRDKEIKN